LAELYLHFYVTVLQSDPGTYQGPKIGYEPFWFVSRDIEDAATAAWGNDLSRNKMFLPANFRIAILRYVTKQIRMAFTKLTKNYLDRLLKFLWYKDVSIIQVCDYPKILMAIPECKAALAGRDLWNYFEYNTMVRVSLVPYLAESSLAFSAGMSVSAVELMINESINYAGDILGMFDSTSPLNDF